MAAAFALLLSFAASPQQLPEIIVRNDDTRITQSCRIRIPAGIVIHDADGDGVIHIEGDHLRVEFAPGSILRGAPEGTPGDALTGIGIRADHCLDLQLINAKVQGYRCGMHLSHVDGLRLRSADLRRNFRQRLKSTPEAEDGSDWLWPHENDDERWWKNYGAGVYVARSRDVEIRDVFVREQQNGIILDRVDHSRIYDNDCSFLSGWGLAMWRCNSNLICRNAFDFCVRGYSHGVYNRGQDSAGILMFEQCSKNVFAENSATHGGDGFFGFAGREALGEGDIPQGFSHRRAGCNDNVFFGNDFSYAVAHGLEMTFSFGNQILSNRFVGNAICGIWGGFSQDTLILGNRFEANGDRGYGLERGGINIDRARGTRVISNQFERNHCGIHFWSQPTGFSEKPWGRANSLDAIQNQIYGNQFQSDEVAIHLRGDVSVDLWNNQGLESAGQAVLDQGGAQASWPRAIPRLPRKENMPTLFGKRRPVGARAGLAGRQNIIMTEWGPWDHQRPIVRLVEKDGDRHLYRVEPPGTIARIRKAEPKGVGRIYGRDGSGYLEVVAPGPGQFNYSIDVELGDRLSANVSDSMLVAEWEVTWFPSSVDPREDLGTWRRTASSDRAVTQKMQELRLPYGMGGPADLAINEGVEGLPGPEGFGTIAIARLSLGAGTWRVTTLSDDGVRVIVDGETVIENWTWHGPTTDQGEFTLERPKDILVRVEHFELDGYSVLELELERIRD